MVKPAGYFTLGWVNGSVKLTRQCNKLEQCLWGMNASAIPARFSVCPCPLVRGQLHALPHGTTKPEY